jgi:hypothetical protein
VKRRSSSTLAVAQLVNKFPACLSKVHYRVHKSPTLDPILSCVKLGHDLTRSFCNVHLTIILTYTPRSIKWALSFRFTCWFFLCTFHLSHALYMSRLSHPFWFHLPNALNVKHIIQSACKIWQQPPELEYRIRKDELIKPYSWKTIAKWRPIGFIIRYIYVGRPFHGYSFQRYVQYTGNGSAAW